ncbi:MAG: hypothetical protein ABFD89_17470 [Bryobacteraceae bacterium]
MIAPDNYLVIVLSRESRIAHGIAQHETIFPFSSGDDLQITEAAKAAKHLQARLERINVASTLAVYSPIAELVDVPSILDVDAAHEIKRRRGIPSRSSSSIGCRSGRIGAGA